VGITVVEWVESGVTEVVDMAVDAPVLDNVRVEMELRLGVGEGLRKGEDVTVDLIVTVLVATEEGVPPAFPPMPMLAEPVGVGRVVTVELTVAEKEYL
jgi:hypothetical protein